MVCSGGEDGTVRIWNPKTGACKMTFEGPHVGHDGTVTCIESSADGDLVLSGSVDGKVRLYQISGKKLLQSFIHSTPQTVDEPESQKQASSRFISRDIDDDNGMVTEGLEETLSVECIGFCNGDLKWIASGGMDSYLKVWDMVTGICRSMLKHNGSVVALKVAF
jgi:WD40 repeat protein